MFLFLNKYQSIWELILQKKIFRRFLLKIITILYKIILSVTEFQFFQLWKSKVPGTLHPRVAWKKGDPRTLKTPIVKQHPVIFKV